MDAVRTGEAYTIKDINDLPYGERAELINGEIYYMAAPGRTHQRISGYLYSQIYNYIFENKGDCEVYAAPFAVFLKKDIYNYVEPDISVICDLSKLDEKGCHGAPDWVIEIVLPGSKYMDYVIKLLEYRMAGVKEYWIVDVLKQCSTVYNFEKETIESYSFGEDIPVGIYKGFAIKIA